MMPLRLRYVMIWRRNRWGFTRFQYLHRTRTDESSAATLCGERLKTIGFEKV